MTTEATQKVTARQLTRTAYLYIRQSTLRQVVENTESTQRQYALRQRAVALGWPPEQIVATEESTLRRSRSAGSRFSGETVVRADPPMKIDRYTHACQ